MTKQVKLKQLVESALDFLSQSLQEFHEERLKYSVIHLYAAVELFVKARQIKEHWSLLFVKNSEPNLTKFNKGDFRSVPLEDAATRLENLAQCGMGEQALKAFKSLGNHRNKMMHFFHEGTFAAKNELKRQEVVEEQLTAWYFLHTLLTSKWDVIFSDWSLQLMEIDKELRKLREFLEVVYDQVREEISERQKKRIVFIECPSCSFNSQEHNASFGDLYDAECLVCGLIDHCVLIKCPDCNECVRIVNGGYYECEKCGRDLYPSEVAEEFLSESSYGRKTDRDYSWNPVNCGYCDDEGYQLVVRLKEDFYFCMFCFNNFTSLDVCDCCNELNTRCMEESYWKSCEFCHFSGVKPNGGDWDDY
ncbi:MAG: hypothetical protein OXC80_06435 [Gammaproteobacteria bacterium]|nr:hypothetical protein [Gammaproteobacteria bacterium]